MEENKDKEMIQERTVLDLSESGNKLWLLKISNEMKSEWFGESSVSNNNLGVIEVIPFFFGIKGDLSLTLTLLFFIFIS
jgi:hypothetical protein